jgi:hypothetical protein
MFTQHEWNEQEVEAQAWANDLAEEFQRDLTRDQPKAAQELSVPTSAAPAAPAAPAAGGPYG